ncbi:MAG TPA: ATP-grasp domain-containing protein, partial [Herpetosiphonaceae bacterium]|nr:ATP-grasp domain-containing protein [Herpetosiphonaceae bacterium]
GLPAEYRRREVRLAGLAEARSLLPAFVKPPNDKSFPARVYHPGELAAEEGADRPVLVAEPVVWEKEFRCFVLDRSVRTASVYARYGQPQDDQDFACDDQELQQLLEFARALLADGRVALPRAAALDIGVVAGRG